jgi:acetyl-CoA acyltransferase
MTVNRYCASGLQTIALAAERIRGGGADCILAGGAESMSFVPFGGNKVSINPWLPQNWPGSYLSMGLTAERVAKHYGITREESDQFSYESHQKALAAIAAGKFADEIVPVPVIFSSPNGKGTRPVRTELTFNVDEGPRADTSVEALSKLKAVFHAKGVVTAGNSSQTSDGAAAAIVMSSERAAELGLKPMARFVSFAYAGCEPEEMGIGPVHAIPKALKLAGLSLDEIDIFELNEAFAAQSLAVIKTLGIDRAKVNLNGGAIALGHPLGCTGAKLTATILREMQRGNKKYGMVTMCVGGGMGAAGIFEKLN